MSDEPTIPDVDAGAPLAAPEEPGAPGRAGEGIGIEHLVDELARLAREPISSRDFHGRLLESAIPAMAAIAGTVWTRTDAGLQPEVATFLPQDDPARYRGADPDHVGMLAEVLEDDRPRSFAAGGDEPDAEPRNATEHLVLAAPVVVDGEAVAVIEVLQRPGLFPAVLHGHLDFLDALCELAAEFRTHGELRRLRDHATRWQEVERFVEKVHGGLDPRATAYTIANDGRLLVDCDRLTVLLGPRARVASVSGVDAVQPRATALRRLRSLVRCVVHGREPMWYSDGDDDLPGELDEPLQQYLEESPARMLAVVPLWETDPAESRRPRLLGVIVAERFDATVDPETFWERTESLASHATPALRNASRHAAIPLVWVNRWFGSIFGLSRLPRTLGIVAILAAVVATLCVVPTDFTIDGRAELQPRVRRDVFATANGVVEEVAVDHGDDVGPADLVVALRDSELDYEDRRLTGELATARQRFGDIGQLLLAGQPTDAASRLRYNQLAAEREELRTRIEGLEEQEAILTRRKRELRVTSPIDGRVLTWDTRDTLLGRPVKVGQALMTVADPDGDWIVEVHVPAHRIGHVLRAEREFDDPLTVEFVLATEPDTTYHGTVQHVALAGEFDGEESTVLVTVAIDKTQFDRPVEQLRPGATVVPRIHCGRRSIAYVWTHEIWETIRMRLLF